MSSVTYDLAVFLGLACLSSLGAVVMALAVLWVREQLLRRRPGRELWPPRAQVECKHITRVSAEPSNSLPLDEEVDVTPPDCDEVRAPAKPVQFVPIQIRVCYRPDEWHLKPADRLIPKSTWN